MRILAIALIVVASIGSPVLADPSPAPTTQHVGWLNSVDGFASMIDQAAQGSGLQPPEGPGFARGNPLSPLTPYDTFASVPNTPGVAGTLQFNLNTQYTGHRIAASLQTGIAYVTGSLTNNEYWTESLLPTLDPHVGAAALPFGITFTTHAGQDDDSTTRASVLGASIGTNDGSWQLRGGWFRLNQTDRFVFAPPALTNLVPSVASRTAESLGDGSPTLDGWPSPSPGLPLHGLDLTLREKSTTLEVSNAALPSLPGTSARMTLATIVLDRGEGTRFSADYLHLTTSGAILHSTTLFGQGATLNPGPQGNLPTSDLGGQQQTIAGVRGSFHVGDGFTGIVEAGRSWYDANQVLLPGTQSPGGYYHAALQHHTARAMTSIEAFRFEPRYATAFLPYGVPENIWSVAWSWPGPWLKSTYQLVDNSLVGGNRQGYRLSYALGGGPLDLRASYDSFQQVSIDTTDLATQTGFVEGFFLPQQPNAGTLGRMHRYAVWVGWHPAIADLSLDYVNDTLHRDFAPTAPQDAVTLNSPQVIITASRRISKSTLVCVGYGRYAQDGSWAQGSSTNVDYGQEVTFAGAQFAESKEATVLVQLRDGALSGNPSIPGGPSPNYQGTMLIIEQRLHV